MISGKTKLPSKHKENEYGSYLIKIKGNELSCEVIETKNMVILEAILFTIEVKTITKYDL